MGELAATLNAWESEFSKSVKALPSLSPEGNRTSTWSQGRRVSELTSYFFAKVPHKAGVPRVVEMAQRLHRHKEWHVMKSACYERVLSLGLLEEGKAEAAGLSACDARRHVAQCLFGAALCDVALLRERDASLKHPSTLAELLAALRRLQEGISVALAEESLYWLVLNGTVHVHEVTAPMITAGFAGEVLEFLVFCVLSLEASVLLCAPKHVPWRTTLVRATCRALVDVGEASRARAFAQRALDLVQEQVVLEATDPVPPDPAATNAYETSKAVLKSLLFRHDAAELKTGGDMAARLDEDFRTPHEKLVALAEALHTPSRRIVRHTVPPEEAAVLIESLGAQVTPLLSNIIDGLRAEAEAVAKEAAKEEKKELLAGEPEAAGEGGEEAAAEVEGKEVEGGDTEETAEPEEDPETVKARTAALEAALQALPMELHTALLKLAFNMEQWELFVSLHEAGQARLASKREAPDVMLAVTAEVLAAARAVETEDGAKPMQDLATVLTELPASAYSLIPDMIMDASLLLWTVCKGLMVRTPHPRAMEEQMLALELLGALHTVFCRVAVEDVALRALVVVNYASTLEETGGEAGVEKAADAVAAVMPALGEMRAVFAQRASDATDYATRFIAAEPTVLPAPEGTGPTEAQQAFSCLELDLWALHFRLQLKVGVIKQKRQALRRQETLIKTVDKREKDSNIFGVVTEKEKKQNLEAITKAAETPSHAARAESALMAECNKNPYQKALLLMQMASFHESRAKRTALLQEATVAIKACVKAEEQLWAASREATSKQEVPPPPRVVSRTSTTFTVEAPKLRLREAAAQPAKYAVYCKPYGSGVAASLHNMEFIGTGVLTPLSEKVVVSGLLPNESYMLAIAVYDSKGEIMAGIGTSSIELVALNPLPVTMLWTHLALAGYNEGTTSVAKAASKVVLEKFVSTTPEASLALANPMSAVYLNKTVISVTTFPILRQVCRTLFVAVDLEPPEAPVPPPGGLMSAREIYLEKQVHHLRCAKKLLMALEVASYIDDEHLMVEASFRLYKCVSPLMVLPQRSPLLLPAFASLKVAMHDIKSFKGGAISRLASSVSYESVQLYLAAGEAAAASAFGKLDLPCFESKDGDVEVQMPKEVSDLEDFLISLPSASDFESERLKVRTGDKDDLAAVIFSTLVSSGAEGAFAALQTDAFKAHPRYLEMFVRIAESAVADGLQSKVPSWSQEVLTVVQEKLTVPLLEFAEKKEYEEPEPPKEPEAAEGEEISEEAAEAYVKEKAQFEEDQRREKAARVLQYLLPPYAKRRPYLVAARAAIQDMALWRSRLCDLLGVIAYEAELAKPPPEEEMSDLAEAPVEAAAEGEKPAAPEPPASLEPLRFFARAAEIAGRTRAAYELQNACRHMWLACSVLCSRDPRLVAFATLPVRVAAMRFIDLVKAFRDDNEMAATLSTHKLVTATGESAAAPGLPRPPSAHPSMGSDHIIEAWFVSRPTLDFEFVHKYVVDTMELLAKAKRSYAVVALGTQFNIISDDTYLETTLPPIIAAARAVDLDTAAFQSALNQVKRDKTLTQEALDTCRALAKDRGRGQSSTTRTASRQSRSSAGSKNGGAVVQSSYVRAQELMRKRGEKSLLVQALSEEGDAWFEAGELDKAIVAWTDALDTITGVYESVRSWRTVVGAGGASLLEANGLWACLYSAQLLAKLAKYGFASDLALRLDSCRASAAFLAACFCCSFSHPPDLFGFGAYAPLEVWEGLNIFADPHVCEPAALTSGALFVANYLVDSGFHLEALPVLSLIDYTAAHVTHDAGAVVHCRALSAAALVGVGKLDLAVETITDLLHGRGLPSEGKAQERVFLDASGVPLPRPTKVSYAVSKLPDDPANTAAIEMVSSMTLNDVLADFYGSFACARLTMVRVAFLLKLGELPNLWALSDRTTGSTAAEGAPKGGAVESASLETAANLLTELTASLTKAPPAGEDAAAGPPVYNLVEVDALCRAKLLLANVRELQWQPNEALKLVNEVMQFLVDGAQERALASKAPGAVLDFTVLTPLFWLQCRTQAVQLHFQLGHLDTVAEACAKGIAEAAEVKELVTALRLETWRLRAISLQGDLVGSLKGYGHLAGALMDAGVGGLALAEVLGEWAELKAQMGFAEDALALWGEACAALCAEAEAHGLTRAQSHAELSSVYIPCMNQLAIAQLAAGRLFVKAKRLDEAKGSLSQALEMLTYARGLPSTHATVALALAGALRLDGDAAKARGLLEKAVTWTALDGGHDHETLRAALLELAATAVGESSAEEAAAYLELAAQTASQALAFASQTPALATALGNAALPAWLAEAVVQADAYSDSTRPPLEGSTASQAHLALSYARTLASVGKCRDGLLRSDPLVARSSRLHTFLVDACPKYKELCVFAAPPLVAKEPPPAQLDEGCVFAQWQLVDWVSGVPESTTPLMAQQGELAAPLAQEVTSQWGVLLFAVREKGTAGGDEAENTTEKVATVGSLGYKLEDVHVLQRRIKTEREAVERGSNPSEDLFEAVKGFLCRSVLEPPVLEPPEVSSASLSALEAFLSPESGVVLKGSEVGVWLAALLAAAAAK